MGSRVFDGNDFLEVNTGLVTAPAFTIGAWFKADSALDSHVIASVADSTAGTDYHELLVRGQDVGDPVMALTRDTSTNGAATSTGITVGTWHSAVGVWAAADDRRAFIDGGSKGTNTTSRAPTGINRFSVGRVGDSSPGDFFPGRIQYVFLWSVALSDAEAADFDAGNIPQPGSLVDWWEFDGSSPEVGQVAATALAVTGSTFDGADSPPVTYGGGGSTHETTSWQSSYTTRARQSTSWASSYGVAARNTATWASSYVTNARQTTSWQSSYGVEGRNSTEWASSYTVRAREQATWGSSWTTRSRETTSWESSYTTKARDSATWASSYLVSARPTTTWQSSYMVEVTGQSHETQAWQSSWITNARLTQAWASSYGIAGHAQQEWASSYVVRARDTGAWQSSYLVSQRDLQGWASSYVVNAHPTVTWQSSYVVDGTRIVGLALSASLAYTLTLSFALEHSIGLEATLAHDLDLEAAI